MCCLLFARPVSARAGPRTPESAGSHGRERGATRAPLRRTPLGRAFCILAAGRARAPKRAQYRFKRGSGLLPTSAVVLGPGQSFHFMPCTAVSAASGARYHGVILQRAGGGRVDNNYAGSGNAGPSCELMAVGRNNPMCDGDFVLVRRGAPRRPDRRAVSARGASAVARLDAPLRCRLPSAELRRADSSEFARVRQVAAGTCCGNPWPTSLPQKHASLRCGHLSAKSVCEGSTTSSPEVALGSHFDQGWRIRIKFGRGASNIGRIAFALIEPSPRLVEPNTRLVRPAPMLGECNPISPKSVEPSPSMVEHNAIAFEANPDL